ncbi:MAG TPA: RHS repeat-associated core domain-containing protein, partial [Candidatus Goldiibacteriota bacterium]|nr:RHS repeat-associated core domain-containing protein [Candidatus Goldiibacteriota bacterium]
SYVQYYYSAEGDMKKREVHNSSGATEKAQSFTYDNAHRVTNDGIYSYTYGSSGCSCAGKIASVTGPNGTVSYEYDFKGRIVKTTTVNGGVTTVIDKVYDDANKKRVIKLDNTEIFEIQADGEGRAVKVTEKLGGNFEYTLKRDNMGRVTGVNYPNGNVSATQYDTEGGILLHKNMFDDDVINKYDFTASGSLDAEGNKIKEKTNLGVKQYGYDNTYQLTSATLEKGQSLTWAYDNAGNRTSSADPTQRTYTPNSLNQYNSVSGTNYTYDTDGNLLNDGTRVMTWNARNRLSTVTKDSKTISYTYDHNDLRVKRTDGTTITNYLFDGSLMLAEKDSLGKIQKVYINDGAGIVGMVRYIYKEDGTFSHYARLYYMFDSLGSVTAITGENGMPVTEYMYSPYGEVTNTTADPVNSLTFVGRYGGYRDWDTGLTYFWHRWYDSKDGRWISRDPKYDCKNHHNNYLYVENRPKYYVDITGYKTQVCCNDPSIGKAFGYKHCFISTDESDYGLHPKNKYALGFWVGIKDTRDDEGECGPSEDDPNVEACLKKAYEEYPEKTKYKPLKQNSNTFVCDLLKKCKSKLKLPSTAVGGEECMEDDACSKRRVPRVIVKQ